MITTKAFYDHTSNDVHLLDGATGTELLAAGMPKGCCAEEWILLHPDVIIEVHRAYRDAGSEIIYAPTFQAQPTALKKHGLDSQTEAINAALVALSRKAAPGCLIAGDMTTMRGCMDTGDEANRAAMVADYRRQIRALINGGADLLVAETLLHPQEGLAVLEAVAAEQAESVMITFAMKADGLLFSGHDAEKVFPVLEKEGAAAIGVNCVAASDALPELVGRLRTCVDIPLIVKPNAGRAVNSTYSVDAAAFARIMRECVNQGANLIGGCCGTTPEYIRAIRNLRDGGLR